jgi:hypothetical protein
MPWFHYNQNNTGGGFDFDGGAGITHHVLIEGRDVEHANSRAESIGLYFDGVAEGLDCDCCGDRWCTPYDAGTDTPKVYDEDPIDYGSGDEFRPTFWISPDPEIVLHPIFGPFEFITPTAQVKQIEERQYEDRRR